MKPSTAWSCLAFSLALASYSMNRDISANVFLACVFIIQGLKRTDGSRHEGFTSVLAFALSAGIVIFSASNLVDGAEKSSPPHFRYKN